MGRLPPTNSSRRSSKSATTVVVVEPSGSRDEETEVAVGGQLAMKQQRRLRREDCHYVKHDRLFSSWKVKPSSLQPCFLSLSLSLSLSLLHSRLFVCLFLLLLLLLSLSLSLSLCLNYSDLTQLSLQLFFLARFSWLTSLPRSYIPFSFSGIPEGSEVLSNLSFLSFFWSLLVIELDA